ncbi:MAG: HEAT repeat domain-containing protein [Terriglobia bacterium]
MDRLRSFLNLERGEEVPVFLLFSYLTLALTSYTIIRAARDGIFLHKFSALELPYVYIGIGIVIGFIVALYIRLAARVSQVWLISGCLVFFILNIIAFWVALRAEWAPAPWIFYVWTSAFGIIITTQVWTVANSVLDLRQARRVFPLVVYGGILGGAAGGLIGAWLVKSIGTENLLLVQIPLLLLAILVAQVLIRRYSVTGRAEHAGKAGGEGHRAFGAVAKAILASPYLRLIVGLLALSAIVTLIVGFQFNVVVQHAFHNNKDQLTAFFASFTAYLAFGAFLLQVTAGSRMVEKLGIRVTLFILPVAVMLGTVTLVAFPVALWAGGVLKGSDYTIRYSIDRVSTELLYVPVPHSVKTQIKAVTDMVVQRLADGVGGLMLLLVTRVLHQGQVGVGIFNLILLSVWVWVAWQARTEYRKEVSKIFIAGPEPLPAPIIRVVFSESASVASLKSMLASPDEEVVLGAIEMAVVLRRPQWITQELIAHPSPRVRAKAVELAPLTEEGLLERVKQDSNSTVRASAILRVAQQTSGVGGRGVGLMHFLQSPDLRVRLSALVALARQQSELPPGTIKSVLDQIATELGPDSRECKEVAEALGDIPHPEAVELHLRLLQHSDPSVKKTAILSAGRAGHRELVPFLMPLLRDLRWGPDARLCLREYGPRILGTLADLLKDPSEDIEIRRSIPLVLAYLPHQESVDILLDGLFDYDGLLRYRSIRALGKLRLLDPELRFDRQKVSLLLREESEDAIWCRQALAALYPGGGSNDLLEQLFKDKVNRGKDRVFRLLALLLPPATAISALLAMAEDDRLKRAAVAEFLDNVLPGKLRDYVLPVIEPKAKLLRPTQTVRQILEACLRNPDPILRECAAEAIGKNRWPEFTAAKAS